MVLLLSLPATLSLLEALCGITGALGLMLASLLLLLEEVFTCGLVLFTVMDGEETGGGTGAGVGCTVIRPSRISAAVKYNRYGNK